MPLYKFQCKVCEEEREFTMPMSHAPRVGTSIEVTSDMTHDQELTCTCGANNWTRMWPNKTGGFNFNMRRTSIL